MSPFKGFPRLRNFTALRTSESVGLEKSNFDDADRIENSGDRLEAVVDWAVSGKVRMAAAKGRVLRIRASVVGVKILMISCTNVHLLTNNALLSKYVMYVCLCWCVVA